MADWMKVGRGWKARLRPSGVGPGALGVGLAALVVCSARLSAPGAAEVTLFQSSDRCMACHNGLVSRSGDDVSVGTEWRSTMMANSARDPYWQAGVRREVMDHPGHAAAIQDECSKCHMPMARTQAHANGQQGQVFAHLPIGAQQTVGALLATDGVSCTVCHQISARNLGQRQSFVGGFEIDRALALGVRPVFGPFQVDRGRARVMSSASGFRPVPGNHLQGSELCATCHTLITHSLGPGGEVLGDFPEQVPYLEWLHSSYPKTHGCPTCHMPRVEGPVAISSVMPTARPHLMRHAFRGGNAFMMRLLNRHAGALGVQALPVELTAAAARTVEHLRDASAKLEVRCAPVQAGRLQVEVLVANRAGHKLPTAYPSRRAWLHVIVFDAQGSAVFESGRPMMNGAIAGNDNDLDPDRFEPHHQRIERPDQVQVYEAILAGPTGAVTTGLLTATEYAKDNRLLPQGFDKARASKEIGVYGRALGDQDFAAGSDSVFYSLSVGAARGPFRVVAELWYQPIGLRWAQNLAPYDRAAEPRRFIAMYQSMAGASATLLASAEASAPRD